MSSREFDPLDAREAEPVKELNLKVRLTVEMHEALRERARRNERTVAGEIRLAIRRHLATDE